MSKEVKELMAEVRKKLEHWHDNISTAITKSPKSSDSAGDIISSIDDQINALEQITKDYVKARSEEVSEDDARGELQNIDDAIRARFFGAIESGK